MEKTERLLDLVAFFLDAKRPVSWRELKTAFPDEYAGTEDTAMRKFERDKAELLELGITLSWASGVSEQPEGYVLDRNQYYLPEVGLGPEELAVLYAAGSAALESEAFPGKQDLAHALRKIAFYADGPLPAPQVRLKIDALATSGAVPQHVEALWTAIEMRKAVELEYFSPRSAATSTRRVNPWGLVLRRGLWHLVGWCHLREGVRTFYVHRIRHLSVNSQRPKQPDFSVPPDFNLERAVATWPWQHPFHEPMEVSVALSATLAPLAEQQFGVAPTPRSEGASITITATHLDALMGVLLSLGPEIQVLGPESAVHRYQQLVEHILDAHRKEP